MKAIIISVLILSANIVFGQNSRLSYADKQYDRMAYYYAVEAYLDVLERGTDSSAVSSKIADCYYQLNEVNNALTWYNSIERRAALTKEEHLRLAILKRQVSDYDGSLELFVSYQQKYGETDITKSMIAEGEALMALQQSSGNFNVDKLDINTAESEIGVAYFKDDQVLFASSRKDKVAVNRIYPWTGTSYYNLYTAKIDASGKITNMKAVKGDVNTKFHDGPATYDKNNGFVYFTRDNYLKKKGFDENKTMRLKIYRAKLEESKLVDIEELPFNSDNFSCGHPTISSDGKTLYFASDMPGGKGGTDIYSALIDENGTIGQPVNLGEKINTSLNEFSPYYNADENILFFSSNGHFGLGGLDVFVAKLNKSGETKKIQNLGVPINSVNDDFSFVQNNDQSKGYVSSNREGGIGSDDIYLFNQTKPIKNSALLKGNILDLISQAEIEDALITVQDKNGVTIDTIRSNEKGNFEVELNDVESDFSIVAEKGGYLKNALTVTFDENKEEYNEDVTLMPIIDYYFAGLIKDQTTQQPLNDVKITIKDLSDNQLFTTLTNDELGTFKTEKLNKVYQDAIQYEFTFEKAGYATKKMTFQEVLALNSEMFVEQSLGIQLDKTTTPIIETGTDLADALMLNPIYFDLNSSYLRADAKVELDKIVKILNENPEMEIDLGAHTDCRETKKYNMWLSERRAQRTSNYIKERITNPSRIVKTAGYGESRLKNDCGCEGTKVSDCSEENHQINRRTEFIVVKMKE